MIEFVRSTERLAWYRCQPSATRSARSRILVARDSALGELILTTPFLHHLRNHFADRHITLLTSPYALELFQHAAYVDEFLVMKRDGIERDYRSLVEELAGEHFELMFCPQETGAPAQLGAHLGISQRVGFAEGENTAYLTQAVAPPGDICKSLRLLHLLSGYCEKIDRLDPGLRVVTTAEEALQTQHFLQRAGIQPGQPLAGINIGGHDYKRWPLDRMARVGAWLRDELGMRCIVFAGPLERADDARQVASVIGDGIVAFHLPLLVVAELIKNLRLMVTNDSGIAWLTVAVGTPSVIIHRPSSPLPLYQPQGDAHLCLRAWYDPDDRTLRGLEAISVEQVIAAAREIYSRPWVRSQACK
jgi:heptosyltransferase-2